jgi:hypothetical protein
LSKLKLFTAILIIALLATFMLPVLAQTYNPGVTTGQYVKYGNFVGVGQGAEAFNDYAFLKLQVTDVSGKDVTLLSTSQFKNGTATAGNGTTSVWNVETGTQNGVPSTQGPIIAANLNQGDLIPPPNTYAVNRTESRTYLGADRIVNILEASLSTPSYNATLTYVYDKASGMLLESTTQTITQAEPEPVTTTISYSVIETNIFGSTNPSPSIPELPSTALGVVAAVVLIGVVAALILFKEKKIDNPSRSVVAKY